MRDETQNLATTIPVLLAALAEPGGAPSRSCRELRDVLEPLAASLPDLELVEAGSLEAVARQLQERRFAAVFLDVPSLATTRAALATVAAVCVDGSCGPVPVIFVTPCAADLEELAGERPHLAIDVLAQPLVPLLARFKLSASVALFRADLELHRRLEIARRSAEDNLATVSHDLRNPLNTVLLAAQRIEIIAEQSATEEAICKSTAIISRAVERMSRLVGDLLDLARLDAGQSLPLEHEQVDLAEQVRLAAELIEPLATARRISLDVVAREPIRAWCDAERVQQVLSNLLGNAVKFTREGGRIVLRLAREPRGVVVSVTDSGIGIAREQLPQIFTAYWQHDERRTRGAGLGLAIAKAIALAHGGSLEVESLEGVGSTFHFRLPDRATADTTAEELR